MISDGLLKDCLYVTEKRYPHINTRLQRVFHVTKNDRQPPPPREQDLAGFYSNDRSDYAILNRKDSIRDILPSLQKFNVGVVLDEANKPIGILVKSDLVKQITTGKLTGSGVGNKLVEEIMISQVITRLITTHMSEIAEALNKEDIGQIVIVDESGQFKGMVTEDEILRWSGI